MKRRSTNIIWIAIVFLLSGTIVKLINSGGRKNLEIYEKAYKDEIGYAFNNKPFLGKNPQALNDAIEYYLHENDTIPEDDE